LPWYLKKGKNEYQLFFTILYISIVSKASISFTRLLTILFISIVSKVSISALCDLQRKTQKSRTRTHARTHARTKMQNQRHAFMHRLEAATWRGHREVCEANGEGITRRSSKPKQCLQPAAFVPRYLNTQQLCKPESVCLWATESNLNS
jgi:hypothetical protein